MFKILSIGILFYAFYKLVFAKPKPEISTTSYDNNEIIDVDYEEVVDGDE